jgi:hypothetical protein
MNLVLSFSKTFAASISRGSKFRKLKFQKPSGFGSRKRKCKPVKIALRVKTGFQSSRKILRQIFPSLSIFLKN